MPSWIHGPYRKNKKLYFALIMHISIHTLFSDSDFKLSLIFDYPATSIENSLLVDLLPLHHQSTYLEAWLVLPREVAPLIQLSPGIVEGKSPFIIFCIRQRSGTISTTSGSDSSIDRSSGVTQLVSVSAPPSAHITVTLNALPSVVDLALPPCSRKNSHDKSDNQSSNSTKWTFLWLFQPS